MALKEYVGAVVLEIDGKEYEVIDLDVKHTTGKKLVKTMNRKGKALGVCRGIQTWELSLTAAVPLDDAVDFDTIENAKLTIEPASEGGKRISYLDCFAQDTSMKYEAENEARISVSLMSLDKIEE